MRLIDADALNEHKFVRNRFIQIGGRTNGKTLENVNQAYQQGWNDAIDAIIDNAPTVEPDVNCLHCDYFKFSQSFIENVVKFMTDYNIETVEDLMKELNHINELLGGKQ